MIQSLKVHAESGAEMLQAAPGRSFRAARHARLSSRCCIRGRANPSWTSPACSICVPIAKGDLNFPFESIAAAMRFIDDVMVPVIVAKEEARPGEVEALVRDLRFAQRVGGSRGSLGVTPSASPRKVRAEMIAKGVAEIIRARGVRRPVRGAAQPRPLYAGNGAGVGGRSHSEKPRR